MTPAVRKCGLTSLLPTSLLLTLLSPWMAVTLHCGCSTSRSFLQALVGEGRSACPLCGHKDMLPADKRSLHVNLGLASILRALQGGGGGGGCCAHDTARLECSLEVATTLAAAERRQTALWAFGSHCASSTSSPSSTCSTSGFVPPSMLQTGRGGLLLSSTHTSARGYALAGTSRDQLDFVVGYEGERDSKGLPHGSGRWRAPQGGIEYVGHFDHGRFHGTGILRCYAGPGPECSYEGGWRAGRYVRSVTRL